MAYLLFLVAVVFSILFNTVVPRSFGLGFNLCNMLTIIPMAAYFATCVFLKKIRWDKDAIYVILLAIIIIIFKRAIGQDYVFDATMLLIVPMLISLCCESTTAKESSMLRRIVIAFYIVECGVSIVEWTLNRSLFDVSRLSGTIEYWMELGFFRSTSLLGHPLGNAQVVAVFMAFIAASDFKNKYVQIMLFFLGYVSLFCFNSRGSILVVTVIIAPYFLWKINKTAPQSMKRVIRIGVFFMFIGMTYMVTQTRLGGRLMNMELMDSSSQTRLEVWDFYKHYKHQDDFIWGHPDNYQYMMERMGESGVENGLVAMLLNYGIVFTIPILLLLFRFQYHKLAVYSKLDKWSLLAVFYIIGNMNPNLVIPVQWVMWVYAYYAFRPEVFRPHTETISS